VLKVYYLIVIVYDQEIIFDVVAYYYLWKFALVGHNFQIFMLHGDAFCVIYSKKNLVQMAAFRAGYNYQ